MECVIIHDKPELDFPIMKRRRVVIDVTEEVYNSCVFDRPTKALELLSYGSIKQDYFGFYGHTILFWAIDRKMTEVAVALIAIGQTRLDYVDSYGNTLLIKACKNNMSEVAIALIATGQSRSKYATKRDKTALFWAIDRKMTDVVTMLQA